MTEGILSENECNLALEEGVCIIDRLDPAEADVNHLVDIFNGLFIELEATELVVGGDEPLYLPAGESGGLAQVISRLDYFSSALHEISHWCIAGKERRKLIDYGYWYEPDGRSDAQQRMFESVEVKPQALEWLMTEACGMRFRLSVDNVAQPDLGASREFKQKVSAQALEYLSSGLPERAGLFTASLLQYFRPACALLEKNAFSEEKLS